MKKFILTIDSLVKTFSIIEAGKDVTFSYENKDGIEAFESISKGDIILGYFSEPIKQIKCVFEVQEITTTTSIVLNKKLEVSNGFELDYSLENELAEKILMEISDEEYDKILISLYEGKESTLLEIRNENVDENYSEEELGGILNEMYNAPGVTKTTAVHMFGLKYGSVIDENNYSCKNICEAAGLGDTDYKTEVNKGLNMYRSIAKNEYDVCFANAKEISQDVFDYSITKGEGINKIFYGTPGCGKSHYIEHDILGKNSATKEYTGEYKKDNIIRTTFYQDYSNTDFVGQILPKIVRGKNGEKDTVEYIFNPGPFTLALIRAISNPTEKVALVVEEINRGNAPAIFGDIFQLLDRDDDCISEYGIVNVGVMDYLNNYTFKVDGKEKKYIFKDIKIPGNMYIYATMNTSDQNVYTLDTAFTRRWEKEKIQNSFDECDFSDWVVPGLAPYTWESFVSAINKQIGDNLEELQVNEDKQIGVFFVKTKDLIDKKDQNIGDIDKKKLAEKFAYKVLDYLWNDVAKLDRGVFFNDYKTLQDLIDDYLKIGVSVFSEGISSKLEKMQKQSQEDGNDEQ